MDLIERQKAIDALADMHCKSDEDGYVWIIRSDAWARIDALPPTQLEKRTEKRTETHACDLISRQAAIRWVKTECNPYGKPTLEFESGKRVIEHLKQMPSVQPSIRCKDCGHFHYDMPYVIQGVPVLGHEVCDFWGDGCKTSENGYCSFAKRKTDE